MRAVPSRMLLAVVFGTAIGTGSHAQSILYVDAYAAGPMHDGSTWCQAFQTLHEALDAATRGATIRVADGTYLPDATDLVDPREATFALVDGVIVEGGYAGCGATDPDARDVDLYKTTLSGDLEGNDGHDSLASDDNAYHVVTGAGVGATFVVDGISIRRGNADAPEGADTRGGAMYNTDATLVVNGCTFGDNSAGEGGGLYNHSGSLTVTHCTFSDNWAEVGGGLYGHATSGGTVSISGNRVFNNTATFDGGGVFLTLEEGADCRVWANLMTGNVTEWYDGAGLYVSRSERGPGLPVTICDNLLAGNTAGLFSGWAIGGGVCAPAGADWIIRNNAFVQNSADTGGGLAVFERADVTNNIVGFCRDGEGVYSESPETIANYNCLWDNPAGDLEGSFAEMAGNEYVDPRLLLLGAWDDAGTPGDMADDVYIPGDSHVKPGSPCINAGDEMFASFPGETDLDGLARVMCDRVDMGAYESGMGDHDCDGYISLADYSHWPDCMTGPGTGPYNPGCETFDSDADGDVDLADFGAFQRVSFLACTSDSDCDDGLYCNGAETCNIGLGQCEPGAPPCEQGWECDEDNDVCLCTADSQCDDGAYCNGAEVCDTETGQCGAGTPPCEPGWDCSEDDDMCLCTVDAQCNDGLYCNGEETCSEDGECLDGTPPCSENEVCEEDTHSCVPCLHVLADDRICAIANANFTGGGAINSATTNMCGANNPPGLLATASGYDVPDPANIILVWSCVSGPQGPDDCDYVSFINHVVPNNGTVAQYTLSPADVSYATLTRSGGVTTVSYMVKPGAYTFQVTAVYGDCEASTTVVYTITSGFDVLSRDASGAAGTMFEDTAGNDSTFNRADTSDDFPAQDIPSNATPALEGMVLARAELTNRVLAPGASISAEFTALVRTAGVIRFSLRDISGPGLGTLISQSSVMVIPQDPAWTETVTATITAAHEEDLGIGTYQVYAAFDSDLGPPGDTPPTPTDLVIHVQPVLWGTIVVTDDQLRAANSLQGGTVRYHGGEAISAANADGADELTGDIIIACDTDNDGIDELVIFDNQDGEGLADATILWTTADPTDNQIDNLMFNQGLPTIAGIAARTTTIDLDTTCDQNGATADTGGLFIAAVCGDYNGDGYVDLVVSTDADIAGGGDTSDGRVALFYHLGGTSGLSSDDRTDHLDDPWDEDGASTGIDNSITINRDTDANAAGWLFGYSLAMGDFSGGTHDDIIIGAPLEDTTNDTSADGNHPGTVYVIQGSGTLITANVAVANPGTPGANEMDQVFEPDNDSDDVFNGAAVALIDWTDGTSGKMDLLVGAPGDTGSADDGRIYLIGGGTTSTSLSEGRVWFGETDDGIGRRLVVCDFDGNGTDDFFTSGVGGTANIVPANGKIYAFMNDLSSDQNGNLTENTSILEIAGTGNDNIGWRLACGDIDGDGCDDLAYSAGGDSSHTDNEVRVILGSPSPGQTLFVTATFDDVNMDQPTDGGDDCGDGCTAARDGVLSLPFDALAIEDINGDGVPDLLMTDEQTGGGGTLYWVCGREE